MVFLIIIHLHTKGMVSAFAENSDINTRIDNVIITTGAYMIEHNPSPTYGDEWAMLGLARGNINVPSDYFENYYNNIKDYTITNNGIYNG